MEQFWQAPSTRSRLVLCQALHRRPVNPSGPNVFVCVCVLVSTHSCVHVCELTRACVHSPVIVQRAVIISWFGQLTIHATKWTSSIHR